MGGVKYPPGKVVGEKIVYVDNPAIRKKYEHDLAEATKVSKSEAKELRAQVGQLEAKLTQSQRELDVVTRDRTRLANLRAPETAPVPTAPPQPSVAFPGAEQVEKLKFTVGKLREELAAAYQRILVVTSEAAVSVDPLVPEIPKPVVEYRNVLVDRVRWDWIVGFSALGALVGFLGAKLI